MQIRIMFNKTEKDSLIEAIKTEDVDLSKLEKKQVSVGEFGSVIYDPGIGFIEINFKQFFIQGLSILVKSFVELIIKGINIFKIFNKTWFSNIKTYDSLEEAITKDNNE